MRRYALILAAASLVGVPAASLAASHQSSTRGAQPVPHSSWKARPATYGVVKQMDVRVAMSDGVKLAVDVIRPAAPDGTPAAGRFPVILTQTPYNKAAPQLNFETDYLVSRGYIQVIADVRGTGGSAGQWDSFGSREQRDGYELAEWAHRLPGGNGSVALHGTSYGAIEQFFTAAQHPAGLKAMFPIVPAGDVYRDIVGSGGQVNTSFIPLWLGLVTGGGVLPPTYSASDPMGAATTLAGHASGAAAFQAATVESATTGGAQAFDNPFYRVRSPLEIVDKVTVPTFVVGGSFDLFQRGEPMLYQRLHANGVPSRLLIGPWYHLDAGSGKGLPADGVPALSELELRWFDHYVRGVADPGLEREVAPVTYFENGLGHWQSAQQFPPVGTTYKAFPLGGAATPGTPGTLGGTPSGSGDMLPYLPTTGICSRSTVQWSAGAGEGAGPACETDNRANDLQGISYDLPTATKPLRVAGPITADLWLSTTARDGQVTARVEDVAPDGTATQYTAGWQVLSLRKLDPAKSLVVNGLMARPWHPFTEGSVLPVTSGQAMEVYVEIFPSTFAIEPGHHLRLSLQSADAPHLTAPAPQMANELGGVMTILHDAGHPSRLILPVVP